MRSRQSFGLNLRAMVFMVSAACCFCATWALADGDAIGSVALISGKAWIRHGDVSIKGVPRLTYSDTFERELGPNDPIQAGDLIVTSIDSYLKIYYQDDSIMDVGPESVLKVSNFQNAPGLRKVSLQLLEGKVRTLVTRALESGEVYRVSTPINSISVQANAEWVTHSYKQNEFYRTDVTALEGKVIVGIPKGTGNARMAGVEQVAITAGRGYLGIGSPGSVTNYKLVKLTAPQISEMIAMIPTLETEPSAAPLNGSVQMTKAASPASSRRPAALTQGQAAVGSSNQVLEQLSARSPASMPRNAVLMPRPATASRANSFGRSTAHGAASAATSGTAASTAGSAAARSGASARTGFNSAPK